MSYDKQPSLKSRNRKSSLKPPAKPILVATCGEKQIFVSSIAELLDKYCGHETPGNLNNEIDTEDFIEALTLMRSYSRTPEQQDKIDEIREEFEEEQRKDEKVYRRSRR